MRDTVVRETYMERISEVIDTPPIKVITGMRRCDKSVIMNQIRDRIVSRGIDEKSILYMNFESMRYSDIRTHKDLYGYVMHRADGITGRMYILLDEIQDIAGWELAVNSFLVDLDCDIYITGSNAKLLSGELATHIAGRCMEFRVQPLTYYEFLEFLPDDPGTTGFDRYLRSRGLPGIHQLPDDDRIRAQYITDIYNTIILKDVIERNGFRSIELIDHMIGFIMDNIGNTFSAKRVSDYVRSQGRSVSNDTVYSFLKALEDAFIIYRIPRYDLKGREFLKTQEKYFLSDLGFRNSLLGYRDNDISDMLENIICTELISRGYRVSIGKMMSKEVDFMVERGDRRIYIQVCYVLSDETVTEREFGPLESIDDNYEKYVLTTDRTPDFSCNGIRKMNIEGFLLDRSI